MSDSRTLLAAVALFACAFVLCATPANADPTKCQREILRRTTKYASLQARLLQRCEDRVLIGRAGGPCPDAGTKIKLLKANAKVKESIAKRCGGRDHVCGTIDDDDLAAIGWDAGVCPGSGGTCDDSIATCDDIGTCVTCVSDQTVPRAIGLYYDGRKPNAGTEVQRCQRALGRESTRYFDRRLKELRKCADNVLKGRIQGPCPDAKAIAKIDKARAKLEKNICRVCGGLDRTCGTVGDVPLSSIGVPASCPDVTVPGAGSCGGTLDDLSDVVTCLQCTTEYESACLAAIAVPSLGLDPSSCGTALGQLIDGPVEGVRYTTNGGATSDLTTGGGHFRYLGGQTVEVSLGGIQLGSATGAKFILPTDLMPTEQAAVNVARFLLTLDADSNLDNDVTITQTVRDAAAGQNATATDFDVTDQAFESSTLAAFARTANGDGTRILVSRAAAELELACSVLDIQDGVYDGITCNPGAGGGRTFLIEDGPNEQLEALAAFFAAVAGDTIEFGEGAFEFDTTLVMSHKENIRIKGQGLDKTILDFLGSFTPEGLSFSRMTGLVIEDLTIWDTPGFSLKVSDSRFVTFRNIRAGWSSKDSNPNDEIDDRGGMDPKVPSSLDLTCVHELSLVESTATYTDATGVPKNYVTDSSNGGYAVYPVLSEDVLLDNVIAIGSSDAGIYVGQSKDVIIKNSAALMNVAGFEIENTDNADMFNNIAHCNVGGFLVFDLPGLNRYGDKTRIYGNYAGYNNTTNFSPGGIVSAVPQGIGTLQLGYDESEWFDNTIEFNRTVGFVAASHELLDGNINNPDKRMDLYPEGIYIHDNTFTSNGKSPQPPEEGVFICQAGTGPGTAFPCIVTGVNDGHDSLLPALIQIKGTLAADGYGPTGAHVVWDGMYDAEAYACDLAPEFAGIVDANGKPQYTGAHNPACRYNKYKFTNPADPGTRRHPQYWMCVPDGGDANGNTFTVDSRKYLNFENTDPTDPPLTDIDAHDCPGQFGVQLAALPAAVVEEYVPGANGDPPPTAEEIEAICADYSGTQVNRAALPYNCEWLSQYNLFADPTDPRTGANEGGLPFDLTTPLFSDYAVKYRIVFLPPGESATWAEGNESAPNATLNFPIGTVIAKTFSFPNAGVENVVETRLLIHRGEPGDSFWEGMAFIWQTDGLGNRTDARLAIGGGTASVSWNYSDPDPDVTATYVGSTNSYAVPHANQCGNCHINEDREPGDAPIGPKVRLLNRPMDYGSGAVNQLQHWIDTGRLTGAPALTIDGSKIATNAQRAPRFNVPGDAFNIPASEPGRLALMTSGEINKEMRARAWIESNCAHCHNRDGLGQSTGVFFNIFRKVNLNYGICKSPTTAGSSSGGNNFDIVPGNANGSIVSFRIHATNPSTQMPPISRSVAHDEGVALIDDWINTVVDSRYEGSGCQ